MTSHTSHEEMSNEDLAMADPQTKILYYAKRDEWLNVETEMETIKRSDFSMADNVSDSAGVIRDTVKLSTDEMCGIARAKTLQNIANQ